MNNSGQLQTCFPLVENKLQQDHYSSRGFTPRDESKQPEFFAFRMKKSHAFIEKRMTD